MIKTTLKVDGMACAMCEAHVNDAVRDGFDIKKVTSSHSKGETVIISESSLDGEALTKKIGEGGYRVLEIKEESYEKKLFGIFKK